MQGRAAKLRRNILPQRTSILWTLGSINFLIEIPLNQPELF